MGDEYILIGEDLKKYFEVGAYGKKKIIKAVDGVTIRVRKGETLGLVGESGSGKSTLGRIVLRVYRPTSGRIVFDGKDITHIPEKKLRPIRRRMQLIPQDPYASFNPLLTIAESLTEPLIIHGLATREEALSKAAEMLEKVGLLPPEQFLYRRPDQFSGGQLQRIAIARAMMLEPDLVIADEPTSSLDVSIRASILTLLKEFQERLNQAVIFITHDLAIARLVSDTIGVMYLGKIVELGPKEKIFTKPAHPYTAALLNAIPTIDEYKPPHKIMLKGEIPDPSRIPEGCRLHPRCPLAKKECRTKEPVLIEIEEGHYVACHNPLR